MEVKTFDKSIDDFIISLEERTQSKVFRLLDLLGKLGHELRLPYSKQIQKGLFELRIRGIQEVRLIYMFFDGGAMVLHGFVKKSEKISQKDLELAMKRKKLLDSI